MPRADLEPLFELMRSQPQRTSILDVRAELETFAAALNADAPEVGRVEAGVPIAPGVSADVLVPPGSGPFPVLVYLHGGGWSLGSPVSHAKLARQLCLGASVVVINVDYRLAPEHPFPAPLDDCIAAVRWSRKSVARFGGDPERIAVGGDSAGGNLSAAVAGDLRGEIDLRAALLVYGAFDVVGALRDYDLYAPSGGDPILPKPSMKLMIDAYLSGGARPDDPRLSPLFADLSQFPPSCLLCGDADPLYGDTLHMHDALRRAGRESELHVFPGMPHAFAQLAIPEAADAVSRASAFLRERLA